MATSRSLDDSEIEQLFDAISGRHAMHNRAMLIVGVAAALRVTELASPTVGDVCDGSRDKNYVTIWGESAKLGKERTIRIARLRA